MKYLDVVKTKNVTTVDFQHKGDELRFIITPEFIRLIKMDMVEGVHCEAETIARWLK